MDPVAAQAVPQAAYGGAGPSAPDLLGPPAAAHDGGAVLAPQPGGELSPQELDIAAAVAAQAGPMEDLLVALIDAPTVLGNEGPGQEVMRSAFADLGLEPVDVPMDADALRSHPGAAPFDWDVRGKRNVVGTWQPAEPWDGRSLILNGHIDVVSPEPVSHWFHPPFTAVREEGWIYGRGSADMKCGLAAIVGAVRGLQALGLRPRAPIHLESVVEEECTGNGTLSCVMAGYVADAGIVAEPFGAAITVSQVGVLWFHVLIRGTPVHAAEERRGVNAIEKSYRVMEALRGLEAEMNLAPPPPYDRFTHPINLNVGAIRGGDWASTVPGECLTSYRMAMYPGTSVRELQDRIEAVVAEVAVEDPDLYGNPPEVRYGGFASDGYDIPDDAPVVRTLAAAFGRQSGGSPALVATTGTTDAGVLGRFGGTPSVCFGPYAEQAHGPDERVWFPSVVQTAQVMASFIRDWCGLSG
jgi:acetylornithine deacetylase